MRLMLKLIAEIPPGDFDQLPSCDEFSIRVGDALRGSVRSPSRVQADPGSQADASRFHWDRAFPAVMQQGGFAAMIGNPPYVRVSGQRFPRAMRGHRTASCPDLYAWCMERAAALGNEHCRVGMILPLSLAFSRDFAPLRLLLRDTYAENWFAHFGRIPSALFSHDVRIRNTIHLGARQAVRAGNYTTRLHRWFDAERPRLFSTLEYAEFDPDAWQGTVPKLGSSRLTAALERCLASDGNRVKDLLARESSSGLSLYFKKTAYNWLAFSRRPPPCYDGQGQAVDQPQTDRIDAADSDAWNLLFLLLNGKLLFVYWAIVGDDFHVTKHSFTNFPVPDPQALQSRRRRLAALANELQAAMDRAVCFKENAGKRVGSYNLAVCRQITDRSDRLFAKLLGLDEVWDEIESLYDHVVRTDFQNTQP
jgi:hypothetical protein